MVNTRLNTIIQRANDREIHILLNGRFRPFSFFPKSSYLHILNGLPLHGDIKSKLSSYFYISLF